MQEWATDLAYFFQVDEAPAPREAVPAGQAWPSARSAIRRERGRRCPPGNLAVSCCAAPGGGVHQVLGMRVGYYSGPVTHPMLRSQGIVSQPLRQAGERALSNIIGRVHPIFFVGNAPMGHLPSIPSGKSNRVMIARCSCSRVMIAR